MPIFATGPVPAFVCGLPDGKKLDIDDANNWTVFSGEKKPLASLPCSVILADGGTTVVSMLSLLFIDRSACNQAGGWRHV
jgi:hypothetical protein